MNWSSNDRLARRATIWLARLTLLVVVLTTTVAEAQRIGHTIHVINRDGTGLRDLLPRQTPTPPSEPPFQIVSEPCWSSDGEQIAFSATLRGDYVARQIVVVDAAGSAPRVLGPGSNPHWSPDGRHIAFSGEVTGVTVMNADGSGREEFVDGEAPVFSPDGRGFVYRYYLWDAVFKSLTRQNQETRYFDLLSGTSRRIDVKLTRRDHGVTWSPDGKWIVGAWGGDRHGPGEPLFVSMDPENPRTVTVLFSPVTHSCATFAWSPDGKTILCAMGIDERPGIQLYSFAVPDLSQPQVTVQLTWIEGQKPLRYNFAPAWSPDGERIVFVSDWGLSDL